VGKAHPKDYAAGAVGIESEFDQGISIADMEETDKG
jgi:hypothetical protein